MGSLKPAPPRAYSPSDPASGLRKNSEAGGGSLSVDTPLVEEETGGEVGAAWCVFCLSRTDV